jgi:hypothetical protein
MHDLVGRKSGEEYDSEICIEVGIIYFMLPILYFLVMMMVVVMMMVMIVSMTCCLSVHPTSTFSGFPVV